MHVWVFVTEINTTDSLGRNTEKKIEQFPWIRMSSLFLKYLTRCWMCYFQAAEMVIKESVEPLLEEYRPAGITSLKFSKLSLGNVAPKIEGVNHWLIFESLSLSLSLRLTDTNFMSWR